jgi:hypothetical protein
VFTSTGWKDVAVQLEDQHGQIEQLVLNVPVSANSDEAVLEASVTAVTLTGRPGIDRLKTRTITLSNTGPDYTTAAVYADTSLLPSYVSVSPTNVSIPGETSAQVTITLDAASAPPGVTDTVAGTLTFNVIASTESVDIGITVDLSPYGDGGCTPANTPSTLPVLPCVILALCVVSCLRRYAGGGSRGRTG